MFNFKITEIEHSDTAKSKGIKNEIPRDLMDNCVYLIHVLQQIRDLLGVPMIINSGYRCEELNKAVGGVSNSAHKYARAADFVPKNMNVEQAWKKIANSGIVFDQLIWYQDRLFIHIGISEKGKTNRQEVFTK